MVEIEKIENGRRVLNNGVWPPIGAPATLNKVNSSNCSTNATCSSNYSATNNTSSVQREDQHLTHFDNSVNAVSFGFVATAILISMFLLMAIFEKFLRPAAAGAASESAGPAVGRRSHLVAGGGQGHHDLESQLHYNAKLGYSSPKMTEYDNGVSVLMPGHNVPTFLARPAPAACPPERPVGFGTNWSSIRES